MTKKRIEELLAKYAEAEVEQNKALQRDCPYGRGPRPLQNPRAFGKMIDGRRE